MRVNNDRPHPGPLPQEREKHSPRLGHADAPGCRVIFSAKDEQAAITIATDELSNAVAPLSLSPGERAGVRAGVPPTNSTFSHYCP